MADNVLDQARQRLDGGKKWCKGAFRKGDSRCLTGAICFASVNRDADSAPMGFSAWFAVDDVIREQYPDRGLDLTQHTGLCVSIPAFNDHPDTTWADIDAVLDKAARRLDEQL